MCIYLYFLICNFSYLEHLDSYQTVRADAAKLSFLNKRGAQFQLCR